ncbi:protein kinase [Mycobacterium sp. CBMA 234]|uniref:serine/threonine-protein kinase n=1 Tax=Mycolicibacterium sp. CBMA 234 TaxID=1918495 RepID=UPI001390FA40|nr:serine/threonine-protein kinase [Mycolicibacterium sp. CBMA 234]MUL66952.1 protein kinase [Mycolicibacterium sp. CBMA 234]
MAEFDPLATQPDPMVQIPAELHAAGFEQAVEIGRGGFGVVYRCLQPTLDRTVAVKVLLADLGTENVERFLREQRAMGRLSGHPHITNVLNVGTTTSGRPFIVLQYHSRGSLDGRIRKHGPLGWPEALSLGVKLAGALETAHQAGILHRDVKPGNILLTDYHQPQLTDFGIARMAGGFETGTGVVTGSPAFTAPEVLGGRSPSAASDVYSLGATLFCAITGHAAFERRRGEQVIAQFLRITSEPTPILRGEDIPAEVSAAIASAMAVDPPDRPATAAAFGEQLRQAQHLCGVAVDELALPTAPDAPQFEAPAAPVPTGRRSRSITPPLPLTRFRPPSPARALIDRDRLIEALRGGAGRRLTLIHGPAGYGKTTLSGQWSALLAEQGAAVAWLSVDTDDNNVVWLLTHLIEAIRQVRPSLAGELGRVLEEHGDQAERYVLTSLINEIHQSGEQVAVVVDDWHLISDPAAIAAMEFLLDSGCDRLQVIVTSRRKTGLPLGRLRVRDELIEIDAAALRFDIDEARTFLTERGGLSLADSAIAGLVEATEGWAAGLQLASLSLRESSDPDALIGQLSGRHRAVGEFLAENVLNGLDPDVLDFLLTTSVTERICGSLASALMGAPGGQAMLEEVEQRDLFLRRLDEEGQWFQYHHLFAQYLRQRLDRDQPGRIEQLHRTASIWSAEHRMLSEAVDHALAADDPGRAVELVERDGMELLEKGRMFTLLGLVAKLPPLQVSQSARLQLTIAWANNAAVRPVPAQAAVDGARVLLTAGQGDNAALADLRAEADVIQADINVISDRIDGVEQLVAECLSRPNTLPAWVVSCAADDAVFANLFHFDFDAARRRHQWALPYHACTRGPLSVVYGYRFAGLAASEQLDMAAAEDLFREGLRLATTAGDQHSYPARIASALLGDLLYERGEIAEAERLLDLSQELGAENGTVDFMIARYTTGARIKALRGDLTAAAQYLDDGAQVAESLTLRRLRAAVEHERARLHLPTAAGLAASPPISHAARRDPADGIDKVTLQLEEATAIRLLLNEAQPEQLELAVTWAREWVGQLAGCGRDRALLQAKRLLVTCLAVAGHDTEARQLLSATASVCAEHRMVRFLLDEGAPVRALLASLRREAQADRWQPDWTPVPLSFLDDSLSQGDVG